MKQIKLTDVQRKVVDLMRDGWELGFDSRQYSHAWLQKRGCGRGGESINVNLNTFNGLCIKKIIRYKPGQNQWTQPEIFELTDTAEAHGERQWKS